MSLLDKLAIKPLLYAIGALLVVVAILAVGWYVHATRLQADLDVQTVSASSANAAYMTSRTRVAELTAANAGWQDTAIVLRGELKLAQDQLVTVRQQGQVAVAAAEARAADADRTLKTFMDRYAVQVKETACAQALQNVEAVCPAFQGY